MLLYLDNCCFNRPFDEQISAVIRMETDAKLTIQDLVRSGELDLCWSFVLDYENAANPFEEVRNHVRYWKGLAVTDCALSDEVSKNAKQLMSLGLRQMDASHIACALLLSADFFLTTEKKY